MAMLGAADAQRSGPVVVIDLETTGLEPARDRIVECALVELDAAGTVVAEWSSLVGVPEATAIGASHLHRLRLGDLAPAPTLAELLPELCARLRGHVVVGHVLAFDVAFLTAESARAGYALPELARAGLCTRELARRLLPGPSYALAACCARAGVELVDAHTALGDARATAALFGRLAAIEPIGLDELVGRSSRLIWAPPPELGRRVDPYPRPAALSGPPRPTR